MARASFLILVLITILSLVNFKDSGVEGATGLDNVRKKRYEIESKVVLERAGRETSLLKHEASVSFEETCKLHHLIQRETSNEHRTNACGNSHTRRNGLYCPATTECISAFK